MLLRYRHGVPTAGRSSRAVPPEPFLGTTGSLKVEVLFQDGGDPAGTEPYGMASISINPWQAR